jgi:hypothetical protein
MKAMGFRKRSRTWWRSTPDTIGVLNLQKSPFGERLYVNLGVYLTQLGQESNPPHHRCHIQTRLERIASERFWTDIASAEPEAPPTLALVEAVLNEGTAWLSQMSTLDGIRAYIRNGGASKGLVFAAVRELCNV